MAKSIPLVLSAEDHDRLESIVRTRTLQAQVVSRARILLLKEGGDSVDAIADKVDLNRNSVLLCLKNSKKAVLKTPYMMLQAEAGMQKSPTMKKPGL